MATKEAILREQTYKEEGMDVERRVFYTLADGEKNNLQTHRSNKLVSALIGTLHRKGVITDKDIDDVLFETVR
jgi:hypothetical protein